MLQVKNLVKTFNKNTINEKLLFNKFNLSINEGDFVTIIGSNGAGKSTFLNILAGSLDCDSGFIEVDGNDVTKSSEYKRTTIMGRVFQNPSLGTAPSMTVLENLSMAYNKGKRFNLTRGTSKTHIPHFKELLTQLDLGLENQLNTEVGLLSGGQRQSLSLIMATMSNPKLLLLDEHTAALDPKTSEKIIELTEKIILDKKITTLMVTHNLNQAIALGNRLIMFHKGNVVLDIQRDDKKHLTIEKLLGYFDEIKSNDLISDAMLFS
ncbi:ATP-binding cassette domain-containing protein [Serpentinicella sp. ANB-PHB4]|uniref:ABC transporter ATP-binding protein n=1 Tax=Serpentinicella sp. ANB-PHB4 TaxID=3074076 RepID=UPI002859FD6D|nr:ATP-binding cassette domain-containing protein [Serpentinicella sp. ANB-PHB4]MDR5658952.1 ATP-binding cassette domain-containing protein [Serpentinicella sp. ANB-PHB4]